jgi:hypothetical protein
MLKKKATRLPDYFLFLFRKIFLIRKYITETIIQKGHRRITNKVNVTSPNQPLRLRVADSGARDDISLQDNY